MSAYEETNNIITCFRISFNWVSVGNNVEAATGNSMKTVQQLNKGDKSLENVKIGESMKSVLKSIVILSILITQIVMKSITNLELIKVFC